MENELYFYTLAMNMRKSKLKIQYYLQLKKKGGRFGINLTKYVKELYVKNYKALMK